MNQYGFAFSRAPASCSLRTLGLCALFFLGFVYFVDVVDSGAFADPAPGRPLAPDSTLTNIPALAPVSGATAPIRPLLKDNSSDEEKAAAERARVSELESVCTRKAGWNVGKLGLSKRLVTLADNIIWQPKNGHVRFAVTARDGASPSDIDKLMLRVCFAWPALENMPAGTAQTEYYYSSDDLEPIARSASSVTYETTFPNGLWSQGDPIPPTYWRMWLDFWHRLMGQPSYVYDGMGIVPSIRMHIVGRSIGLADINEDPNAVDASPSVGLSFQAVSLMITLLFIIAVWAVLLRWGKDRHVSGDIFLRIITNRNNYASLSQFQILVWTVVIGGGAVYVMSLSGTLINIPEQALALLGISGFSALTAAIKQAQDNKNPSTVPATPQSQSSPVPIVKAGAVTELRPLSVGPVNAILFWRPSQGGLVPTGYSITCAPALAAAMPIVTTDPFIQLSGLNSGTAYAITVETVHPNGGGAVTVDVATVTARAPLLPPGVSQLSASLPYNDNQVLVDWSASGAADGYVIQYQRAGAAVWETWPEAIKGTACTIKGLDRHCTYQFRVVALRDGQMGAWSGLAAIRTKSRVPHWSDLVVWDGIGELDITRVQMFVFTVIAATFVAIKIADENVIPTIPDSIVVLMGLTNGIYVGGKYVGASK